MCSNYAYILTGYRYKFSHFYRTRWQRSSEMRTAFIEHLSLWSTLPQISIISIGVIDFRVIF